MFSIFHNNFPPRNLKLWLKGEAVLVKLQFIKLENGFTTVEMKLIGKRQMDCFAVWVYMFTLICVCVCRKLIQRRAEIMRKMTVVSPQCRAYKVRGEERGVLTWNWSFPRHLSVSTLRITADINHRLRWRSFIMLKDKLHAWPIDTLRMPPVSCGTQRKNRIHF